jgi:hypothetical protein
MPSPTNPELNSICANFSIFASLTVLAVAAPTLLLACGFLMAKSRIDDTVVGVGNTRVAVAHIAGLADAHAVRAHRIRMALGAVHLLL